MSSDRKITIIKQSDCGKMQTDKLNRPRVDKALQELEALECEVGRINKRIAAVKEILKAA